MIGDRGGMRMGEEGGLLEEDIVEEENTGSREVGDEKFGRGVDVGLGPRPRMDEERIRRVASNTSGKGEMD